MTARLLASLATVSLLALQGPAASAQVRTTAPKGAKPAVPKAPPEDEASPASKAFDSLKASSDCLFANSERLFSV